MANTVPNYEKLKKTLRALLLSTKNGCTPRSLMEDYKLLYGEAVPYKQLGFKTLMELLHDMRDTVAVVYRPEGTRLYGIADKNTKHIADMVASQKDGKKKKGPLNPSSHPTMSMITKRSASWGAKDSPVPKAPLTFHSQLKTLFLSYPNGVALHDFTEAFARRFGYYFSYKGWGFTTLEQALGSIPEVITVETDQFRKLKIVRLTKLPARDGVRRPSVESINTQKSESVEVPQSGSESLNSLELSPRKSATRLKRILATKDPPKRRKATVPKKVVDQVETILRAFPTGIWLSRFPNEFKKYFDEDLPVSTLGFSSVLHLLTSTPVCEVERPTGLGDWLVFRRGGPRPKVADNHQFLHEAYVSDDLVRAVHRFMKRYPKGIPLTDFTAKFEEQMKHELPVEEFGFNSVAELLQRVRGIDVSKPPESKKVMVFSISPICESETESSDSDRMSAKEKDAKLTDVSSQNKPRSVYVQQPWPSKDDKQCKVYVTYVKTPSCFCVQLIGNTTTKALEALQEDMTAFFNSKDGNGYTIKEPYIGQACCAIFNNDGYWYRSEIVSIPTFDIVEVHYVDYGNRSQVPLTSIRRPKAHYLTLPAQSLNCRLANLKPAGSTWSRVATQLFSNMTNDKPIVAFITAVQDNCMSVCLCDTNKKEVDIHINDCLRNQGLAIFDPDTEEDQRDYDGYELESSTLQSWDEKDVRSPGNVGTVASASLKNTAAEPKKPVQTVQNPQTSSLTSTVSQAPPSTSTPQNLSTSSTQPSLVTTKPAPPLQNSSSQASLTPLPSSITPTPQAPPLPPVSLSSLLPNVAATPTNLPMDLSSSFLGGGALPGFQAPNPQIAQLQMQNYQLQQLLLIQQNALLSGGSLSMFGLQGIANPLLTGSQTANAGLTGFGTGQTGLGTGLGTGQTSLPPGFAPPGLAQNAPPVVNSTVVASATDQASQSGLTTQFQQALASDSNVPGSADQTGLTTQQVSTNGDDVSVCADSTNQTPPTSMTNSTHPAAASSTHSVEDTTPLPLVPSEPSVVADDRSTRQMKSSSLSLSSRGDDSSSLSSEGETRQSSRKKSHGAGATTTNADSCVTDSSESEGCRVKKSNNGSVVVGGESQLFYSGGAGSPAWAKEKAFIKRVRLTGDYSLSIVRHDDKAYFLSSEVSEWFWESDLLQSMLRQVQKPCWGLIMTEKKNKKLFQTLRRVQFTSHFVLSRQQITVYALEDLPHIVSTFHGPVDLCTAVRDQVEAWQLLGLTYFTAVSADEVQVLENTLTNLKEKRKHLAQLIIEEEDEGAAEEGAGGDSALNQLIETKKRIVEVNRQLSKLKKLASISRLAHLQEPANLNTKRQSSSEPSSIDDILKSSKPRKSSGPLVEGVSSSNRVGEAIPPPDVVKSDDILNTVVNEKANTSVEIISDPLLESPVYPDAPLLPENGSTEMESHDVNICENAAEIDPLFEDMPEEEEEEDEDSVFIDEDNEQPSIPALAAASVTMTTDLNSEEKEGEAPVIPPSSKSYSSVASSPPTKSSSFNRSPPIHQRQQNQQQYPQRQFRASSLPPRSPSTSDKPVPLSGPGSHTQNSTYSQRPPSPAVYSTRPQGSEFIPIPSVSGASHHPTEQEWPTLHASSQQPQQIRTHNNAGASNQNASPPQWPIVGSTSPPKLSKIAPKTPPTPTPSSVLGSPPLPSSMSMSSSSNSNFANPLLPTPALTQRNLPPRFTKMQQALPASQSSVSTAQGVIGVGQGGTAKRRPAGIGRGGRPLPPLDSSLLGSGVHVGPGGIGRGVPTVRPILSSGGRPPMHPPLYMVQPRHPVIGMPVPPPTTRGHALLPSPLRAPVVMPPPITSPIPVSPEERWIYMSRRGRTRSKYDYPPLGSSAGLDII